MSNAIPLVYVLGDSISIQYGPYLEKFLAEEWRYDRKRGDAEARLNLDRPAGANGGDSALVLDFLRGMLARPDFQPDLLLVNCGAHDIKTNPATGQIQIPLPDYRRHLDEIAKSCTARKISLAWISSTHQSDEIHNLRHRVDFYRYDKDRVLYDAAAREIMAKHGAPVIDLAGFTRKLGPDDELFCDHAHFHEAVREKQAAFIAGWLLAWKALR